MERRIFELEGILKQPSGGMEMTAFRDGLATYRQELERHIREENEGGCLEEAVCRCPSLGPRVSLLQHEHADLLASIDELLGRLGRSPQGTASEIAAEFSRLSSVLRTHEVAENQILAQAFGIDWTADDPVM
jgi:hypothetical protein